MTANSRENKLAEAIARLRAESWSEEYANNQAWRDAETVCDAAESAPRVPDAQQVSADELLRILDGDGDWEDRENNLRIALKGTRSLAPLSDFCPKCGGLRTSPLRDVHCELFHRSSLAPETCPLPEKGIGEIVERFTKKVWRNARWIFSDRECVWNYFSIELESWLASQRAGKGAQK